MLEHGLVNLIHVVMGERGTLQEQFSTADEFYEQKFRKMLGKLVAEVRELGVLSDDTQELIAEAVRGRNHLAHEFFRERSEQMLSHDGQRQTLFELRDRVALFMRADHAVEVVMYEWGRRSGITPEAVATLVAKLRSSGSDS